MCIGGVCGCVLDSDWSRARLLRNSSPTIRRPSAAERGRSRQSSRGWPCAAGCRTASGWGSRARQENPDRNWSPGEVRQRWSGRARSSDASAGSALARRTPAWTWSAPLLLPASPRCSSVLMTLYNDHILYVNCSQFRFILTSWQQTVVSCHRISFCFTADYTFTLGLRLTQWN